MKVVYTQEIGDWVAERIKNRYGIPFENYAGLAVVSGNHIMGGVIYDEYDEGNKTIQISVAIDDCRCWTKNIVKEVLSYPFDNLGVYRVWFQTPHNNERLIKVSQIFGFTMEAVLKNHFGREHAAVGRILYPTYRRIYKNGK